MMSITIPIWIVCYRQKNYVLAWRIRLAWLLRRLPVPAIIIKTDHCALCPPGLHRNRPAFVSSKLGSSNSKTSFIFSAGHFSRVFTIFTDTTKVRPIGGRCERRHDGRLRLLLRKTSSFIIFIRIIRWLRCCRHRSCAYWMVFPGRSNEELS